MSTAVLDHEKDRSIATPREDISEIEEKLSSRTPTESYITPPDGGRGWLIVLGSFTVNNLYKK